MTQLVYLPASAQGRPLPAVPFVPSSKQAPCGSSVVLPNPWTSPAYTDTNAILASSQPPWYYHFLAYTTDIYTHFVLEMFSKLFIDKLHCHVDVTTDLL